MLKASICLDVYKPRLEYLKEFIELIFNYTFKKFEFFIVYYTNSE